MHARFFDHAGLAKCSRWRSWTYCLPLHRQCRHPGSVFYRGSMAGLHVPLPTLRRRPHRRLRTARGRCGSLLLHRSGLAPPNSLPVSRRTNVPTKPQIIRRSSQRISPRNWRVLAAKSLRIARSSVVISVRSARSSVRMSTTLDCEFAVCAACGHRRMLVLGRRRRARPAPHGCRNWPQDAIQPHKT